MLFSFLVGLFKNKKNRYKIRKVREKREKREKIDLSVGFGVRPACERACRRRSPLSFSINCPAFVSSPSLPASALSKLWPTTNRGVSVLGVKTRLLRGYDVVKMLVVWVLIPGDGGFHSSVAAGFCFREVVVSSATPSSALVSGGEGYNSFASPTLGISLRFLEFGFRLWNEWVLLVSLVLELWPCRMRSRRAMKLSDG
ncbi:hypothetical protein F2Q69_00045175 [Brassica cretica]|uniref:Uncharacterized protein n=1 Tax=Brassica cretica TaxID=69181 RepID=A0A8S9NLT4_BRACR|nr:hypothetical protein F2Q69_00045175 [Brassica cretica]